MKPNTHKTTVILADMGKLRAFRISPPGTALSPHDGPVAIEEIKLPEMERNTDSNGRFPQGRTVSEAAGICGWENHNEEREDERRRSVLLARKISDLVAQERTASWCFAAPAAINKRILGLIPSQLRDHLVVNITADLTHLPLAEIEHRFVNSSHKH